MVEELTKIVSKGKKNTMNLHNKQRMGSSDENIILKFSGIGGNIVILNLEKYMAIRQLNNKNHYRKLSEDPSKEYMHIFHLMLNKWNNNGLLDMEELNYLKTLHPIMPMIYFLPKVHKNLVDPPRRPIVSLIGLLLENTLKFIDILLFPYVKNLPSNLHDSQDFLNRINDLLWKSNYHMATVDVVSLYTSIQHTDGIEACKYFL